MAITQETIAINDFADIRRRTLKSGKTKDRLSINVTSEVVVVDFDDRRLGRGPSEAIRDYLEKQVKGIDATAAPETIARRRRHRANPDTKSYKRRYTGGRTGHKPPTTSVRLFNDSSRLSEGLFVRENRKERGWTINVPANRLNPQHWGGELQRVLEQLREHVPEIASPRKLITTPEVRKAINQSIEDMITVASSRLAAKKRERAAAILDAAGLGTAAQLVRKL